MKAPLKIDLERQAETYRQLNRVQHRQLIYLQAAIDKIRFWCDTEAPIETKLNHVYFLAKIKFPIPEAPE